MDNISRLKYMVVVIIVFILFTVKVYAKDIGSSELIDKAKNYDGQQVTYKGEVIGDVMKRGDYAWINVSDGDNAIGIWVPYEETRSLSFTGSYDCKGDEVRITGIFNRACAEHGGDFDIHSDKIEMVSKGHIIIRSINRFRLYAAGGLLIISLALFFLMRKKRV